MWTFNKVVSSEIDMAGKYRVLVSVMDGTKDQWLMLKFQSAPKDALIKAEAQKQINLMNLPPAVPEPTIDDLKKVIMEKDAKIAEKDAKITELSKVVTE